MSKLDEIIDELMEDESAMIPRPATEEDIVQCQKDLEEMALEPLPESFVNFLKKTNDLSWNGIEFYSTYQVSETANPEGYQLMDLVSMNDEFNNLYELDEKVFLGRADEDYYTYDTQTRKYEALDRTSRETMEEFDTFDELFCDTVGGRLQSVRG